MISKQNIKTFSLLLFALLILSCEQPNVKKEKTGYVVDGIGRTIEVFTIDDCEYLYLNRDRGAALAHKGNCSNPIHNE